MLSIVSTSQFYGGIVIMAVNARQAIAVHYRKLGDVTGAFGTQTLEAAIRKAMQYHSDGNQILGHWKLRAWEVPPNAEDTLLMNLHHDGGGYFFGDLTQYTKGYMQTLIEQNDDMPVLSVEQQPAPKGKEYVHSMMYWLVVGSHVLLIQSRSLMSKHLEEYLTWLLKDRTPTIAATGHVMLQAKFDAAEVGGDLNDIQEIIVGGSADIHSSLPTDEGPTERTVESYREVAKRMPWKQRAIEVLRAVMANEADVQQLLQSIPQDADLQVSVHIGYKASRKVSRAPMQQALRHLPEGEIKARGRDGKITGSDIRLHHTVHILKNGSLLDPKDVIRALRETYKYFVDNGKIQASG